MKCSNCNTQMSYSENNMSIVWTCPICNNSLITTNANHILLDDTIYSISILAENTVSKEVISTISKITNCNFIESKTIAISGRTNIFSGKAVEIIEKKKLLDIEGIHYSITPDFNW